MYHNNLVKILKILSLIIFFYSIISKRFEGLFTFRDDNNNLSLNKNKRSLIRRFNKYIFICKKGRLLFPFTNSLSNSIKITALIPVFNASNNIRSTIRSIQNQNMEDIEIILVDDQSQDSTIEILENLKKEDKRIKIIRNKINRGTLYSRSIGALNSKGKYIMSIDNDDFFLNNIFNICYKESEKYGIDIIEFSGLQSWETIINFNKLSIPFYLQNKVNNLIINQPELSTLMYKVIKQNYTIIDGFIWGKSIKSLIYKKAIRLVGNEFLLSSICWSEDRIVSFAIFQIAKSFKFIDVFGILHYINPLSVGQSWEIKCLEKVVHDEIMYIINIYNLTKLSSKIDIAAYEMYRLHHLIIRSLTEKNNNLAKNLYISLISSDYTSNSRKKKLISLYGSIFGKR